MGILNLKMNKLFSAFAASLFLITCAVFFTTCAKEYSYEGGFVNGSASGTAVYTLNGEGGECLGSLVMGNYYAGTPLNTGDTVQLQVNVTTAGTYILSTGSADGINFSASGNFTDTGMQTIMLSGNGTPVSAGSFSFTPPVGLGCFFVVNVDTASVPVAAFTLAGAPNECENAAVHGDYVEGIALIASNIVVVNVNVTAIGAYRLNTDTLDGISFSTSGTFTATGIQSVILSGSGTPQLPANLVFTPFTGTSSCTFPVTVLNTQPLAVYVLESGFGAICIDTTSGNYISGIPLSNTNNVSMHVYVAALGNFTIATNTVNGMMFYYTGTFTTLGAQYITLTGSGTPAAQGIYTFTPQIVGPHPLGGESCSFKITVQ